MLIHAGGGGEEERIVVFWFAVFLFKSRSGEKIQLEHR